MALTIKMQINEKPENTYVFDTDGGGSITLIPLSVIRNGHYEPESGFAYGTVDVNVPETIIEQLNITKNGTYTAETGKAYDVVTVNVEPVLHTMTASITSNGQYTYTPEEGVDGFDNVVVNVDVPSEQAKLVNIGTVTLTQNGHFIIDPKNYGDFDGVSYADLDINVAGGDVGEFVTVFTKASLLNTSGSNITQSVDIPTPQQVGKNTLLGVQVINASAPATRKVMFAGIDFTKGTPTRYGVGYQSQGSAQPIGGYYANADVETVSLTNSNANRVVGLHIDENGYQLLVGVGASGSTSAYGFRTRDEINVFAIYA